MEPRFLTKKKRQGMRTRPWAGMPVWIDLPCPLLLVWLLSEIHQYLYIGPACVPGACAERNARSLSNAVPAGVCLRQRPRCPSPLSLRGLNEALGPWSLLRDPWLS